MATKLKPIESTGPDEGETTLSLLSELNASLKAEHAAHRRLTALARKIAAKDDRAQASSAN